MKRKTKKKKTGTSREEEEIRLFELPVVSRRAVVCAWVVPAVQFSKAVPRVEIVTQFESDENAGMVVEGRIESQERRDWNDPPAQ